jgi:hypothetical protein
LSICPSTHRRSEQPGSGHRPDDRAINQHVGIDSNERRQQSTDALVGAITALDAVADEVQADLAERFT